MSTNHDDEPGRSRLRWLLGAAAVLAVPLAVVWWPGCREYPPVSSKESLYLMKLLYSACNTRDEKRLAEVEAGVEKLTREGTMSAEERAAFDKIIGMARSGRWADAQEAALKFAQDQVGRGHPAPDDDHDHHHHDHGKAKSAKGGSKR